MMKAQMKGISLMIILLMLVLTVQAAALRGTVTDKATKEPLIGEMCIRDSRGYLKCVTARSALG